MSDEDENSGSTSLAQPEEEALRLKTLAADKYNSGNLKSALKYAKRAHSLHPSVNGLPEMLAAFKILRAAAAPVSEGGSVTEKSTPDYYKILQVERFSHINTIKKQYKKLALTLHPDKNPYVASEEAFKLVGEAARVLSDKIRRKEYDMKLRIAMQSKAAEEVGLGAEGAGETFWTACSTCRLLHQFERKYLGHNLMCPSCKKTFKAMEVEEGTSNGGDGGSIEKNEGVVGGQTRVSARIQERIAKGGHVGILEKFGLGVKRKISSVGEVSEKLRVKVARTKRVEEVGKSGEGDGAGTEIRDGAEKASESGRVEIVESGRAKRAKHREEENMTLSQMRMLVKKNKKRVEGKLTRKEIEVNAEKLEATGKDIEIEKDKEREKEKENVREQEREESEEENKEEKEAEREESEEETEKEKEADRVEEKEEDKEKDMANLREKTYRRRLSKARKLETVNNLHSEIVTDGSSENGDSEVLLVEKEGGKEKEKEMVGTREKRERRRVSKYGNLDVLRTNNSKDHVDSEIEAILTNKKGGSEIMPVEDSDFYDFDKDRRERSFKKGQVWAVYDDDDGMPRHYGLIDKIVSLNPFEVTIIWLRIQSNGDEELLSVSDTGFHISCGIFQVSRKVTVKYLNLFSHRVDCERAAREVYRIYPKKGSVWAMYSSNAPEAEERDQRVRNMRCYDIVVLLSSYSDMHGLSIAYLEKVPGFRTVFKRQEVGANAVICLGPKDVKLFSHQIPAKKLSGRESSGLPKDCWELDPASLTPPLLIVS